MDEIKRTLQIFHNKSSIGVENPSEWGNQGLTRKTSLTQSASSHMCVWVWVTVNVHKPECMLPYSICTLLLQSATVVRRLLHTLPAGIHSRCISRTQHLCFTARSGLSHSSTLTKYPGHGRGGWRGVFWLLNNVKGRKKNSFCLSCRPGPVM